jgi:uncharacterized protein
MPELEIVARLDAGSIGKQEITPIGGLRIDGYLTRVGVLEYRNPDGSTRRELRHPDDVFAPASLASLHGAPVTVGHPPAPGVTTANWRDLAVGHIGDVVAGEGRYVAAPVLVQDATALGHVGAAKLRDISCGYTCAFDPTPGIFEGQQYDGRQTAIKYNHVALLPRGGGRAGKEVQLRIDSHDASYPVGMSIENTTPSAPVPETRNDALEKMTVRMDAAEKALAVANARADMAEKALATAEAALALANDPKRLDGLMQGRLDLVLKSAPVMGPEWKADGKTDAEIKLAVVQKADPTFKADGKTAEYINAYFDLSMVNRATALAGAGAVNTATAPRVDSVEPPKPSPRDALMASQVNAWKGTK